MLNVADFDPLHRFRQRLNERWESWIKRRIPPSKMVTLDQKRIFIFPPGNRANRSGGRDPRRHNVKPSPNLGPCRSFSPLRQF